MKSECNIEKKILYRLYFLKGKLVNGFLSSIGLTNNPSFLVKQSFHKLIILAILKSYIDLLINIETF